jgi:hypothetical protein
MSVEVRAGTPAGWSAPRQLLPLLGFIGRGARPFDVAPDGERFVMLRPEGGGETAELILVQNFFEVLRELAPN